MPQDAGLGQSGRARRRLLCAGGLAWLGLAGCQRQAVEVPPVPGQMPIEAALRARPQVAWVLGSGGPRGLVHVGVIKALEELGLKPDVIVGASAGAVIGALCAGGLKAAQLEQMALEFEPWRLLRPRLGGPPWLSGRGLAELVNELVDHRPLQTLPVPMVCAVQRMRDGEVVGLSHGDTGLAVQASSAIEGPFAPLRLGDEVYADADQRMPLPVRLARRLGAVRVLAVDASAHEDKAPPGSEKYREMDLRKRALTQPDAAAADVLLHPDTGYWAGASREYRERLIAIGYRETLAQAAALRAFHSPA